MKKMFALLMILMFTFNLMSCSSTTVDNMKEQGAKITAKATAMGFAKVASCKKVDLIEAHAYEKLMELEWFKPEAGIQKSFEKGFVSQICVAAVDAILPFMVDFGTGQLPEEWECSGDNFENITQKLAHTACSYVKY